jgi:hypothetical protein
LENRSNDELADVLEQIFHVDREQAIGDIHRIKQELLEKNFIEHTAV